jgi:hypothetical protein
MRSGPRALLVLFCAVLGVVAVTNDSHGTESIDIRTYVEMVRGVSLHGLPYLDNGPVERFSALQVPWNVFVNGRYWGVYAPAYAYFGAPFIHFGLRALGIATAALLVPMAVATFELAKRVFGGDEWSALAASVLAIAGTPVLAKALDLSSFPLATLFVVLGAYGAIRATDESKRWGFVGGVCFAFAIASHMVATPLALGAIAGVALGDARAPGLLERTALGSRWPTSTSIANALSTTAGLTFGLAPVSLLNHLRFRSWNPISYGPTPWRGAGNLATMSVGGHLSYAVPVLAVVLPIALGLLLAGAARRPLVVRGALLAAAAIAFAAWPLARSRALEYVTCLRAYLVDVSTIDELVPPHTRLPGVFGAIMGPWVVKSTLQASPFLALAALVRPTRKMLVLGLPIIALYSYFAMRANIGLLQAIGFSWVHLRYTVPALPLFAVMAVGVVREERPPPWIASDAACVLMTFLLSTGEGDEREHAYSRHLVLLVLPLVLAASSVVLSLLRRRGLVAGRVAGIVVALACGASVAAGLAHDWRSIRLGKIYCHWRLDDAAQLLPQRFALLGSGTATDNFLALRAERDVQYAQIEEGDCAPVIEHWLAEDRPVYYVALGDDEKSPWPGFDFVTVSKMHRIHQVVKRP